MKSSYVLIVGCTGVGKSAVQEFLSESIGNHATYADPYVDNPFIGDAYSDGSKSFQSEMFFFKEFLKIHKKITQTKDKYVIQERSIFECVEIFCKTFYYTGKLTKDELLLMQDLLSEIEGLIRTPDIILHITAEHSIIMNRIQQRNRSFEKTIDTEFIRYQANLYDKWVNTFCNKNGTRMIRIDNSCSTINETNNKVKDLLCI